MRKIILASAFLLPLLFAKAQAPYLISYQAVVRNAQGQPLANAHVNLQFTIHQGSAGGGVVFMEADTVTTNQFGLASVQIGSIADLSYVPWATYSQYLQVGVDITGGTIFADMGTTQLLSVPYALSSPQWYSTTGNVINANGAGNVGIGTAAPSVTLDVFSGSNNVARLNSSNASGTNLLFSSGSNPIGVLGYETFDSTFSLFTYTNDISFGVNNLSTEIMRLKASNGWVGIGTSNPVHNVEIANGDLCVGAANQNSSIYLRDYSGDSLQINVNYRFISFIGTAQPLYSEPEVGFVLDRALNIIHPVQDNTTELGDLSDRWSAVYAANGVIQTSDERLKKNIHDLSQGLSDIMQLRPVAYEWKNEADGKGENIGFIAQEVEKILPQAVVHGSISDKDMADARATGRKICELQDPYGMNYSELIPVLVKSIQEQQKHIDQLQNEVNELRSRK